MDDEKPIDSELDRLAAIAEAEDSIEPEKVNPATGEVQDEHQQQITNAENALALATGTIKGVSKAVGLIWGVEYDEKTQQEGIDALAPCLERGAAPPWLMEFAGRYGCYIGLGVFVCATGYATYSMIQQQKAKQQPNDKPKQQPNPEAVPDVQDATQPKPHATQSAHAGFGTDGER